jgi:hypothetical protein
MTIKPSLRSSPFRSHKNCRLTRDVSRPDAYLYFDGCVFRRLGICFVVQCRLLRAHTIGVLSDRCGINRRRLLCTRLRIIGRYIEIGAALDLRLNRDQAVPMIPGADEISLSVLALQTLVWVANGMWSCMLRMYPNW